MTPIMLEEGNIAKFDKAVQAEMDKAMNHLEKELLAVRTGKAQVSMIEGVKVECYGTIMNLKDVASLTAPDVNLLTIQPWDKGLMHDIERALNSSHLGITPKVDDDMIRLEIPKMSSERREELSKLVNKKIEECKIAIRNIRKDMQNLVRDNEKNKTVSQDFAERLNKSLQDSTDKYTKSADVIGDKKKHELKAV